MTDQNVNTNGASSPMWRGGALAAVFALATFGLGLLAASVMERRTEAEIAKKTTIVQPIDAWEVDSAKWGANFPREYDSYKRMADDKTLTKYGGAVPRDYLVETPANVILFAGYAFAKDYKQARGHTHAIEDVTGTKRISPASVATCWTCKSPDVPRLMNKLGPEKFYAAKFDDYRSEITHPIGCLDCHEPNTMKLRVSRPALREAFQRQGKDVDQASHQEMRTLVCAQCHVEYYFKPGGNYLTFPWDKGVTPEKMDEYYTEVGFTDWTHAISKTKMIKLQHPDYEVYSSGVHAYRNVSCADCHMPYKTEGGMKFSDHHVQSPLLNIANSCAVCHRWSEEEIRARVESIQDKNHQCRQRAETAVAEAHLDIAAAMQAGATDDELKSARDLVRAAQLRWDYVAANNGMGFHSPGECLRILTASVDLAGQCRVECARILAQHGVTKPIAYPDYGTKEKAQALIKLFIDGAPPKML